MAQRRKLILWVGKKHSGKTTSARKLYEYIRKGGFGVGGLLAPSIYEQGRLTGFYAVNLKTHKSTVLARCSGRSQRSRFVFVPGGVRFARNALRLCNVRSADLVIVDEFGPLEIEGGGWRKSVDRILTEVDAIVMLVVRNALAAEVRQLYRDFFLRKIAAREPHSRGKVLKILQDRFGGQSMDKGKVEQQIIADARNRQITCASCFKIARKNNISLKSVGSICNKLSVKIRHCQLGCF